MIDLFEDSNKRIDIIPVILSGGSGTRLWPLSRASYPKQYLNLEENNNYSLLQNTYLRLKGLDNLKSPIIISNEEQRFIVAEQMREINVKPSSIILEPTSKNTAPAIALAALKSLNKNEDPTLLILSSDHKIDEPEKFRKVIQEGLKHSEEGRLVTFGIIPSHPETGYGYIESFDQLSNENSSSKIKKFIEKPNLGLAKELIKDKHYVWNSGIFLFRASTIIKELEKFEPELIKICDESLKKGSVDIDFYRINQSIFQNCPNTPIDIAVMERTKLGSVITLDAGWDDIGNWKSVWKNASKDEDDNSLKGKVILENSKNCFIRAEERLIVGIDLKNLIIIETKDAILVANNESTHKVKAIVEKLNNSNYPEGRMHKQDFRPWGSFTNIEHGAFWKVKRLEIKPQSSISLQMHNHRSEHWIVVDGEAKVEIDGQIKFLKKNESTYIPIGSKHRLSNQGDIPLVLIEVQSGDYFGEDDIIRFEDNYGRAPKKPIS